MQKLRNALHFSIFWFVSSIAAQAGNVLLGTSKYASELLQEYEKAFKAGNQCKNQQDLPSYNGWWWEQ